MNGFINFWLRFFDYKERDTILTMLTVPNSRRILRCSLSEEIRKTQLHASKVANTAVCLNGRNSTDCLHNPMLTPNRLFFQNPQILRTISFGHDVIHTPVPFPFLGFIMAMCCIAISLKNFIHMQKHRRTPSFRYERLLTSWLLSSVLQHEERETQSSIILY